SSDLARFRIERFRTLFERLAMVSRRLGGQDSPEGGANAGETRGWLDLFDARAGTRKALRCGFDVGANLISRLIEEIAAHHQCDSRLSNLTGGASHIIIHRH